MKRLLDTYEADLGNPPLGKKYEECWDIHRKTPHEAYVQLYDRVKKEIEGMGVPFSANAARRQQPKTE